MPSAVGLKLAVIAVPQEGVVVGIRLQVDAAALSAITARWPAPRHILLPPERDAAVAAVPRLHKNLRFINKHLLLFSLRPVCFPGGLCRTVLFQNKKRPRLAP